MSLNGTTTLINSKLVHSKVRGRAFVEALGRAYDEEEKDAATMEGTKKSKYDKKSKRS